MLGERSDQRGLWEADRLYLDHVGRDTFYALLASLRGRLFRDADFAEFYCSGNGRDSVPPRLLLTAHRAKGLEFDHVLVLDGAWDRTGTGEDADALRRLYYVAMTRARQTLALARLPGPHPIQDALLDVPSVLVRQERRLMSSRRRQNCPAATGGSACGTSTWASRGVGSRTIPCTGPLLSSRPGTRCRSGPRRIVGSSWTEEA